MLTFFNNVGDSTFWIGESDRLQVQILLLDPVGHRGQSLELGQTNGGARQTQKGLLLFGLLRWRTYDSNWAAFDEFVSAVCRSAWGSIASG